jgi:hypothetical protein
MKRLSLLFLLLTGCSTAPFADLMDYFSPGRIAVDKTGPRGGVCGPQQPGPPAITTTPVPPPSFPVSTGSPGSGITAPVLGSPVSTTNPPVVTTTPGKPE